jgi:hypothetical protein
MSKLEKDIKATKESIAKWDRNSRVRKVEKYLVGSDNCPLCVSYRHNECEGCPIAEKAGDIYCRDTPYADAEHAWDDWYEGSTDGTLARENARKESAFLREVLADLEARK